MNTPRYKMSLSCKDFDNLFAEDLNTFKRRLPYRMQFLRRSLIKRTAFPVTYILREDIGAEEYRGYVTFANKHQYAREGFDIDSVVLFRNARGICAYADFDPCRTIEDSTSLGRKDNIRTSHRYLFTPHFFERYELRHGKHGNSDIYNQFFCRNMAGKGKGFYTLCCDSRPDDYKDIDVWSLCEDGLMLGQIKGNEDGFLDGQDYIIQINTFLDIDTLTKRQDKYRGLLYIITQHFAINRIDSDFTDSKRTFITNIKKIQ